MSIIWRDGPDRATYEQARTNGLFNARIPNRYPLAIASPKTEREIIDTVNLAIGKKCRVSVRAGGHSFPSWSVRDDAILVDLGQYSEIDLDEHTGIVRVSPSTTGNDLNEYLSARGRTFPVGHCPSVGVGGFLLSGGIGWNSPSWGWACECIVAVDVVTASGELVRADARNNTDLFWAARGGGPAFPGIVTRFYLQTRPLPRVMRSSGYVYPARLYGSAMEWAVGLYDHIRASGYKESVEIAAYGSYQKDVDGYCVTVSLFVSGDDQIGIEGMMRLVNASRPDGTISSWYNEATSIRTQLHNTDKAYPPNHRYCVDNVFLGKEADVVAAMGKVFSTLPTRESLVLWNPMKPGSECELADMALSVRSDNYVSVYAIWEDEEDDVGCQSWVSRIMGEIEGESVGSYLGEYDFQTRPAKIWGEQQYKRLLDIRRKWDPTGRICGCLGLEDMDVPPI